MTFIKTLKKAPGYKKSRLYSRKALAAYNRAGKFEGKYDKKSVIAYKKAMRTGAKYEKKADLTYAKTWYSVRNKLKSTGAFKSRSRL